MNKIHIIGNLTNDSESGSTNSGTVFCRFTVAVNRPYTDDSGNRPCDYFEVVAWQRLAERCGKYLFKGNKVAVSGEMQQRRYKDRDGNTRITWDLVANDVEFLTPKSETGERQSNNNVPSDMQPVYNDDLPF